MLVRLLFVIGLVMLAGTSAFASAVSVEAPATGIKPYGFIRLDGIYNDARFNHPHYPNYVLLTESAQNEQHLHPRLSRVGIEMERAASDNGLKLDGKLEIDFQNGGSESRQLIRMRHAYGKATLGSFVLLFGQTWQVASQLYPTANADSMMWGAGNIGDRSPQLRLTWKANAGERVSFEAQAAAMMPNSIDKKDVDGDHLLDGANAGVPAFQGRLVATVTGWTQEKIHLAVAIHQAKDKVEGAKTYTSEGVFAEVSIPIVEGYKLRGEWFNGQNLSDVRGGIGQGLSGGKEVGTTGFWSELVAGPTPWLKLAIGYGQDNPSKGDLSASEESPARLLNAAAWAVAQVKPAEDFRVGLEYLRYETTWLTDAQKKMAANRVNAHFTFFF